MLILQFLRIMKSVLIIGINSFAWNAAIIYFRTQYLLGCGVECMRDRNRYRNRYFLIPENRFQKRDFFAVCVIGMRIEYTLPAGDV